MERRPAVVLSSTQGRVRLRYTSNCSACGGCGGRCQLFATGSAGELELDGPGLILSAGETVEVELPHALLLRQAAWAYGLPLLGLLVGAALLQPMGNPAAGVGALLGTSVAVAVSKRAVARLQGPRIRLPAG